jgi:hypothetical protein
MNMWAWLEGTLDGYADKSADWLDAPPGPTKDSKLGAARRYANDNISEVLAEILRRPLPKDSQLADLVMVATSDTKKFLETLAAGRVEDQRTIDAWIKANSSASNARRCS